MTGSDLGAPFGHYANGELGAAESSVYRFVASSSFRMSADSRRYNRKVTVSYRRTDGTSGWTTLSDDPAVGAIDDTHSPGVSIAYDDSSSAVLYAFRADNGEILLSAGVFGTPFQTGVRTIAAPQISCAPSGALNCILVTIEPGRPWVTSTSPRLRWFRFEWDPVNGFVLGLMKTDSWIMQGGPPKVSTYFNGTTTSIW